MSSVCEHREKGMNGLMFLKKYIFIYFVDFIIRQLEQLNMNKAYFKMYNLKALKRLVFKTYCTSFQT